MMLIAAFCGVVLIAGCFGLPQRRSSRGDDELEMKCSFDDNELTQHATHFGTVTSNNAYFWENGKIPYYFNLHRNIRKKEQNKKIIEKAVKQIETRTCFRFLKLDREPTQKHHLEIKIGEPSCKGKGFSAGVRKGGPWKLVLESERQLADSSSCLNWEDGILHELMHVLGVMHTQKRKDRDQHIIINERNIKDTFKAKYQYEVCEGCNSFGTPYDCSSIMHYGTSTYGKPDQDTMTAIDPSTCQLTRVGSAFDGTGAQESDWKLLNIVSQKVCSGPLPSTKRPPTPTPDYDPYGQVPPYDPYGPTNSSDPYAPPLPYDPYGPPLPYDPYGPKNTSICLTDGGPDAGAACVFPFIYDGQTYNECTIKDADDDVTPWCSTKTDRRNNHVGGNGHYGTCGLNCPEEEYYDYYG